MQDNRPECEDFASVVGTFVANLNRVKALQSELKELRQKQAELQKIIIAYMETQSLDVCRINKDGESGQLSVNNSKSTKGVKRDSAVAEIAHFFEEHRCEFESGNVSTKADELWGRVQETREARMTETGAAPHTLFIKQNCRYCALLRASLDDAGLMGDFAIVDVDVTPVNPQQVSHVPTIVADRQRAMSGRDAFAWAQDYINSSPQCMTSSSIGKCTGWESMSSTFAFIDGEADANVRTNTSMSAVYSSFDTDVGAVETDAGKIDDPLADAVANLQNERNAAFQAPRRA